MGRVGTERLQMLLCSLQQGANLVGCEDMYGDAPIRRPEQTRGLVIKPHGAGATRQG